MTTYKRKTTLNLLNFPASLPTTENVTVPHMADIQGILTDIPTGQRNKVIEETKAFYVARAAAGASYLAMGGHLAKVRNLLEPLEKWKVYINLLPNITQATAYRMIWAAENAERALPPATRQAAILDGYKLISSKKDETFAPGYDVAVKQVTKELGPAPERDLNEARTWLQAVMVAKRKIRSGRGTSAASVEVTIESQEARIVQDVQRAIAKLPEESRAKFGTRVAGMIINLCHSPVYKVKTVPVPEHYLNRNVNVTAAA